MKPVRRKIHKIGSSMGSIIPCELHKQLSFSIGDILLCELLDGSFKISTIPKIDPTNPPPGVIRKVRAFGEGISFSIPREFMKILSLKKGDEIEYMVVENSIILTKVRNAILPEEIETSFIDYYRDYMAGKLPKSKQVVYEQCAI